MYCAGTGKLLVAGTTLPLGQQSNFTVPCINDTGGYGYGYGPDVSANTFTGGYLSRFTPPESFWDSSVPSGLQGLKRALTNNWTRPNAWRMHAYHPQVYLSDLFSGNSATMTLHEFDFQVFCIFNPLNHIIFVFKELGQLGF